jgi:hypothetical protein
MNWDILIYALLGFVAGVGVRWLIDVLLDLLTDPDFNRRIHDDEEKAG